MFGNITVLAVSVGTSVVVFLLSLGILGAFRGPALAGEARLAEMEKQRTHAALAGVRTGHRGLLRLSEGLAGLFRRGKLLKLGDQLEGAMRVMATAVQTGKGMPQALEMAAWESPEPLKSELRRACVEYNAGLSVEEALWRLHSRYPNPELHYFITALEIHGRYGGNLPDVMARIADAVRERRLLRGELRAKTAESRLAAVFLAIAPPALGMMLSLGSPGMVEPLLSEPLGRGGLVYAAFSWATGVVVQFKLLNMGEVC